VVTGLVIDSWHATQKGATLTSSNDTNRAPAASKRIGLGFWGGLARFGATASRTAQAVAGAGLLLSAGGFYLQTRALKSDIAGLELQVSNLEIEKRRLELDEETNKREKEAAEREARAAELERAERLFSMANGLCTLSDADEINSRLKLLGQVTADSNIDSRFCLSYRGGESFAGSFALPVGQEAEITGRFGFRYHPILMMPKMHAGIDWVSPANDTVLAPADGLVTYAGSAEGYGERIILDHGNGWRTTYSHLDEIKCRAGDIVLAGQVIGRIGATGATSGKHLHFEVLSGGSFVDPEKYLPIGN
jgi:murein DD-endopeptidase MepM/ murein hydrolase activator NlpD